jgi:hypothetical protein
MAMQVVSNRWPANQASTGPIKGKNGTGQYAGLPFIRRPTRGIVLKEETFATLRVVSGSGENRWLIDAGSRRDSTRPGGSQRLSINGKTATNIYSNFFLQTIGEERIEKQQILETFGEPYVFFFGQRARVMSFSGILVNTWDFNWEAEWWDNYENELRGTKCVENDAKVFLQFDNTLIGGYIMASSAQKNAQDRNWVNFSFQMFITSYATLTNPVLGSPDAMPSINYSFVTQNIAGYESSDDPALLAPLRPVLLDADPDYGGDGETTYGKDLSLANQLVSAWSNGLKAVASAWDSVDGILAQATALASQAINGDNIRIPIGFQGALAFDQEADVSAIEVQYGGLISYTTFSNNDDEFVGSGDQYASSKTYGEMLFLRTPDDQVDQELQSDANQLAQAQEEWAAAGIPVPNVELGAISQVLHSTTQLGLAVATGVQNWGAYVNNGNAGSSPGPFAAVLSP